MNQTPRVTLVTVCYNNAAGLERTLRSVATQTFTDKEYIVIDGGSTDGSVEKIRAYADKIDYWVSEPDKGIYNAMNKAIAKASGEYMLFINSGDWLAADDVLEKVFGGAAPEGDLLIGRQRFATAKGKGGQSPRLHTEELTMGYFLSSTLPHQATFIRRSLFDTCGRYDESYRVCADWVFWIEAVVKHGCRTEMLPLAVSYMEAGGVSGDMDKCHADMSRYLEQCLRDGTLRWDDIFDIAIKSRNHELATRKGWMRLASKALAWIGKRI